MSERRNEQNYISLLARGKKAIQKASARYGQFKLQIYNNEQIAMLTTQWGVLSIAICNSIAQDRTQIEYLEQCVKTPWRWKWGDKRLRTATYRYCFSNAAASAFFFAVVFLELDDANQLGFFAAPLYDWCKNEQPQLIRFTHRAEKTNYSDDDKGKYHTHTRET